MLGRAEPLSLSPGVFSPSASPLLSWVYFVVGLIDGLAFITRLTTGGLLKVICNVNTFIFNHIFFRLGLTFMNIKAVWMGSAGLWEYVCRREGGLAACAVLGDASWICLRAKGSGAGGREAARERVCVRQKENPSALERNGKKGEGARERMHEGISL